jgi:hypothetical protein
MNKDNWWTKAFDMLFHQSDSIFDPLRLEVEGI